MSTLATATNATYLTAGPTGNNQQIAFGGTSNLELAYIGYASWIGNGAATSATLNYIDGTAQLSFTPSAIMGFHSGNNSGGNAAEVATTSVTSIVDAANSNKTATVTFSAAPANNASIGVVFMIFR